VSQFFKIKSSRVIFLVLVICFIVLAAIQVPTYRVGIYNDEALYINLAQALATGRGYVDPADVVAQPHTFVPPLFPIFLAPILFVAGFDWLTNTNFILMQFLSILLLTVSLVILYHLLLRLKCNYSLLITILFALNPRIISGIAIWAGSEGLYLLLSLLAFYLFSKWEGQRKPIWLIIAVISASLTSVTRIAGITLVICMVIGLFIILKTREWVGATVLLIAPLIAWFGRNVLLGVGIAGGYATHFQKILSPDYLGSIYYNLTTLIPITIPDNLFPILASPVIKSWIGQNGLGFILPLIGTLVFTAIIVGAYKEISSRSLLSISIVIYSLLYVGMLIAISGVDYSANRYLSVILPFLLLFLFNGIEVVTKWLCTLKNIPRLKPVMIGITATSLILLYVLRDIYSLIKPVRQVYPDISLGATWLYSNTGSDSIVLTDRQRDVYLYGHRRVEMFLPILEDVDDINYGIQCSKADYVLVQPSPVPGLPFHWDAITTKVMSVIGLNHDNYYSVFESQDKLTSIYRIDRSPSLTCP